MFYISDINHSLKKKFYLAENIHLTASVKSHYY